MCVQLMKRRGDRKLIKRWIKITYILGDSFTIDSQFDVVKSTVTHLLKSRVSDPRLFSHTPVCGEQSGPSEDDCDASTLIYT